MAFPSSQPAKKQATLSAFFAPKSSQTSSQNKSENHKSPSKDNSNSTKPTSTSISTPSKPPTASKSRTPITERKPKTVTKTAAAERSARTRSRTVTDADVDEEKSKSETEDETDLVLPRIKRARIASSPIRAFGESDREPNTDKVSDNNLTLPSLAVPSRTSRFIFSSSPAVLPSGSSEEHQETEQDKQRRERLHEKFVKKLGKPDSLLELRRRRRGGGGGEDGDGDGDENDENVSDTGGADDDEEVVKPTRKTKVSSKKGGSKLTPLEKQVLDIKKSHLDTVLVVEVGYKFKFFGEDARIASQELGIMCIPGKMRYDEHPSESHLDRFAAASIPTHRLHVHVRRLVYAGRKVGVVRQLETAALKAAGDNRGGPFVRKLTNLYTKATYVDDLDGLEDTAPEGSSLSVNANGSTSSGYILCLAESDHHGLGSDEKVKVALVAVQPATGDVIYDSFADGFMRVELETRLLHISPAELIIVGDLSPSTERLITHLTAGKSNVFGDQARIERVERGKTMAADSFSHTSSLYADRLSTGSGSAAECKTMEMINNLPEDVTICLSVLITHLTEYGLEHVFDLTKYFTPFSSRAHMLINANTLSSLEIYQNQTDFSSKGSLFWCLDRTKTRFGQRLLRKWVGRPLLDRKLLEERLEAVEELASVATSSSLAVTAAGERLRATIGKVKWDLEKTLLRLHYKKSSRSELYGMLETLRAIGSEYKGVFSAQDSGFKSPLLGAAIASLSGITDLTVDYLCRVQPFAAKRNDKFKFFHEQHETAAMTEHKSGIQEFEARLDRHRSEAAKVIGKTSIQYVSVAGIEFLIELDNKVANGKNSKVPASWIKVSGTKKVSRFHSPEIVGFLRKRDEHKEALAAACEDAFVAFMTEIGEAHYQVLRDCVQNIAVLDCLLSLAEVAAQEGYVKPEFVDPGPGEQAEIDIKGARHPMVERIMLDAYVPNDLCLRNGPAGSRESVDHTDRSCTETSTSVPSALLITGPNMGGKSSFVRSIALVCLMAQLGSFVPATSASLPLLDAIYTRMGACDNLLRGESTFMVEVAETSDILRTATNRSLVILDELGRGTSTHDGYAIAEAVVRQLVQDVGPMVLFVTHYQGLGKLEAEMGGWLKNVHMRFEEVDGPGSLGSGDSLSASDENGGGDGTVVRSGSPASPATTVTFLYQVAPGMAHRSYGLNVARLAHLPVPVIEQAARMSRRLERLLERRKLDFIIDTFEKLRSCDVVATTDPTTAVVVVDAGGGNADEGEGGHGNDEKWLDAFVGAVQELNLALH